MKAFTLLMCLGLLVLYVQNVNSDEENDEDIDLEEFCEDREKAVEDIIGSVKESVGEFCDAVTEAKDFYEGLTPEQQEELKERIKAILEPFRAMNTFRK